MGRRIIALCVVTTLLLSMLVGCSPKISVKDVKKDPREAITDGFSKTSAARSAASYSPLNTASRAAEEGSISVELTTAAGSKAYYQIAQSRKYKDYYTSFRNGGIEWACALDESENFLFRPGKGASWYALQLHQEHHGYADTQLAEVLNCNDHKVWSKIQSNFRDMLTDLRAEGAGQRSDYQEMVDAVVAVTGDIAPSSVGEGLVYAGNDAYSSIQLVYPLDHENGLRLFDVMLGFYEESDTDYDAYLTRLFRDALYNAGCEFYAVDAEKTAFERGLFQARYNVEDFFAEAARGGSLVIDLDEKTGNAISVVVMASGGCGDGFAAAKCSWISVSSGGKLNEEVEVSMDCVNAKSESFTLSMAHDIVDASKYSNKTLCTYTTGRDIIRTNDSITYDKSGGTYEVTRAADGRDVTLRGTITDMQKEFRMTVSEIECEGVTEAPIAVDISINAVPGAAVPDRPSAHENLNEMSVEDTRTAHKAFITVMPAGVFGDWLPNEDLDPKLYEEFDSAYDYNKDGTVDEKDKSYYNRIHLILTAPSA